jgi:hypothetical protein
MQKFVVRTHPDDKFLKQDRYTLKSALLRVWVFLLISLVFLEYRSSDQCYLCRNVTSENLGQHYTWFLVLWRILRSNARFWYDTLICCWAYWRCRVCHEYPWILVSFLFQMKRTFLLLDWSILTNLKEFILERSSKGHRSLVWGIS